MSSFSSLQLIKSESTCGSNVHVNCSGHCDWKREFYREISPKSTMVLFSAKSDKPLAALSFTPTHKRTSKGIGCKSMLIERLAKDGTNERDEARRFQGMMSLPDHEFVLTMCNLSYEGSLRLRVCHRNSPSRWWPFRSTSPRLNFVDVVDPGCSVRIDADYEHGNCKMILSTSDGTASTSTVGELRSSPSLTVKDVEAKGKESLSFDVLVWPEKGTKLAECFAEGPAKWRVVSSFVRTVPSPSPKESRSASSNRPVRDRQRFQMSGRKGRKEHGASRYGSAITKSNIHKCDQDKEAKCVTKQGPALAKKRTTRHSLDVGSTLASSMEHGERVPLYGVRSWVRWDEGHPTETTLLGLSIWPEMPGIRLPSRLPSVPVRQRSQKKTTK